MPNSRNTFGGRIASLLEKKGMTQSDLARRIGKSPQTVQKWVNGGGVRGKNLEEVAKVLGTTEAYLLAGDSATIVVAEDQSESPYILIPMVKWIDVCKDIQEIVDSDLVVGRVPAMSGIHGKNTVCTTIEEGGAWMDDRIKDGTIVFVQKNPQPNELKSGQLVIAKFGGRVAPRMLMLDGDKKILITTNNSLPTQSYEMQSGDSIEGLIMGAYIPFN